MAKRKSESSLETNHVRLLVISTQKGFRIASNDNGSVSIATYSAKVGVHTALGVWTRTKRWALGRLKLSDLPDQPRPRAIKERLSKLNGVLNTPMKRGLQKLTRSTDEGQSSEATIRRRS
jgi:hypothetical protein